MTDEADKGKQEQAKKERARKKRQYLDSLRLLRAEIQDLRDQLTRIKAGNMAAKDNVDYFKKTIGDVNALIKELEAINKLKRSDTCRRILNSWEKMQKIPLLVNPADDRGSQEQLHDLALLDEEAGKIILYVGQLTIPQRLSQWIDKSRVGYYLPFHLLFEDEIPTTADRARVLNSIAWAPDAIHGGLVYPGSGLIYRYETEPARQLYSLLQVIIVFGLATLLVWELCYIGVQFSVGDWIFSPSDAPKFIVGWFALLAGVVIHIGVEAVKRSQSTGLPPVIAINDFLKHVSARKGDVIFKILISIFGLFGLVTTTDTNSLTAASAFLVGYSLDSFVGLFGTSVQQKAAAQATALKEQLGIKAN